MNPPSDVPASDLKHCDTPEAAIARLKELYAQAHVQTEERFQRYIDGSLKARDDDSPVYPYLCAVVPAERAPQTSKLALGRIAQVTVHGTTVTQPALFERYLEEQLRRVMGRFSANIFVGRSHTPIPLTFALEKATSSLSQEQRTGLQYHFHTPNLVATNDDVVDGQYVLNRSEAMPLSLFPAERTDYSLHRIQHYTATNPTHFQNYVLFTNYQRYVDEFIELAKTEIDAGRADALVEPGERITRKGAEPSAPPDDR